MSQRQMLDKLADDQLSSKKASVTSARQSLYDQGQFKKFTFGRGYIPTEVEPKPIPSSNDDEIIHSFHGSNGIEWPFRHVSKNGALPELSEIDDDFAKSSQKTKSASDHFEIQPPKR